MQRSMHNNETDKMETFWPMVHRCPSKIDMALVDMTDSVSYKSTVAGKGAKRKLGSGTPAKDKKDAKDNKDNDDKNK